jgi:hypothetical protein
MATADYWSSADLKGVAFGGLINEDVMQQIWDISSIPLPFTDAIGSDTIKNSTFGWTTDKLAPPDLTNAAVDGEDASGNDAAGGVRVKNEAQISTKVLQVTQRARNSDTIGRSDELAYQVMMRQREARRDVEAISLSVQGSVMDDGDAVAGKTGAFGAWLETNTSRGATTGADGGFNTTTGLVDPPIAGDLRALTETAVRDMLQSIYEQGGDATLLMSTPAMIRGFSEYLFTASARIATQTTETGKSQMASTAIGAVNVFVSDFGSVVELTANRLQPVVAADNVNVYGIDPGMARLSYLQGYRTETLGKPGLSDKRQISVDWGLKVLNEAAHGVIADINPALPVTQA